MRKITSREYKMMLDHHRFVNRKAAVASFWQEASAFLQPRGAAKGRFDASEKRTIQFLDTPDCTLVHNGLVLRARIDPNGNRQYTLKARTADRYIANGADLAAADGLRAKEKFEEDISAPFVSRFSHSNTISMDDQSRRHGKLKTIKDAGRLFRGLLRLRANSRRCDPETPLEIVNNVEAYERVFTGPRLILNESDDKGAAEVALILWSNGPQGRPLVAEFSFRYRNAKEDFSPSTASAAKRLFELIQRLDWVKPGSLTKTQYVYRTAAGD